VDGSEIHSPGPAIPLAQWTHVAATWDGQNLIAYTGSTATAPVPASGVLDDSATPLYIGADRNNNDGTTPAGMPDDDFTNGSIDEVRIENVARSPEWIAYDLASQQDAIISYGPVEH